MNVGIGALEIQMLADVSRLRRDMAAAEGIVGKSMAGIASSARLAMSALSGLGVGIGVGGLVAIVRGAVDAMDALNDLADATGSSIEELAKLERIARLNGATLDTVGAAMIKLNQVLNSVDGKNTASLALRELGLSAEKLKNQDISKSLRDVAGAINGFADTASKGRYQLELLGKSTRELAPFLKDVAESTDEAAVTTARMAREAEQFNKNMALLSTNAGDVARTISGPLVESINQLFDALRGRGVGGSALSDYIVVPLQTAAVVAANVTFVLRGIGTEIGGIAAQAAAVARLDFSGARTIGKLMREDAAKARADFDALERRIMSIGRELPQASYSNEGRGRTAAALRDLGALEAAEKAAAEAAKTRAAAGRRAADEASRALKEQLALTERANKAALDRQDAYLESLGKAQESEEAQLQRLRDQYIELVAGKEVLADLVNLREEERAVALERKADGTGWEEEAAELRETARLIREQIALRKGIMSATATREAEQANARAADAAVDEWSDASQQIGQALADALMRGGQSAIEYIRGLVRTLVFQPVLTNVSNTAVNAAGNYLGTAANAGLTWATGSSGWSGAGGISGYGASLANYGAVYSGAAYGTGFGTQQSAMLAAQEAGMVSSAGGASASTIALWAAAIAAGVYKANQDWNAGFRRDQARDVSQTAWGGRGLFGDLQPMGGLEETKADFLSRLGFSDKIADLFSGATAVAALFGRAAPRITSTGLQGTFAGGAFEGGAYADVLEKGGLFRSDKRYTQTAALTADLERFLDSAAAGVADQAKAYGEALGLPVAALSGVTRDIKIELTADTEANKTAIMESLAGYGDALVAGWAEAVAPLAAYGETTVQTIQRIGTAIVGVNSVLEQIGVAALAASIDGGKAAMALTEAFGGADNLVTAATGYFAAYFTEAEKSARATEQITAALQGVGLALPESRAAFRSVVEGLDLTSEGGREQFRVLMQVAGAYAELNPVIDEAKANAERLAEAMKERAGLEERLLQLQGDTAALRERERAALDETNRALYDQITALEDQQAAAEAARITAEEAAEQARQVADERLQLERQLLEVQGDTAALLALERDTLDESNRALFDRIQATKAEQAALEEYRQAADRAAQAVGRMYAALDANLGKFQTPEQATRTQVERMAGRLGEVGVNLPVEALLGATRQQILDFATAFVTAAANSTEAKTAVIEVAGALADLRKAAEEVAIRGEIAEVNKDIAELTKTFGDLANLNPVATITQQLADGVSELERLEAGLASVMGTMAVSIQDALADMISTQRSLQSFRAGLANDIADARLTGMSPTDRVAALRATEAALFGQLGSAKDPAAVAARLQQVILKRVQEEVALRQAAEADIAGLSAQARADQIDTLRAQIEGFERLRDLAADIGQFTASMRFSDLSPLNPEAQLAAAQRLFDETAAKARGGDEFAQRNLTGNAQALLQEARGFFASGTGYASIFNSVLAMLDEIGAAGVAADPQIAALEAQLAELQALNDAQAAVVASSQAVVEGFTRLDEALAAREAANEAAIKRQAELAQKQIDEQRLTNEKLAAQIEQAAKVYQGLIDKLDELNDNLDTLATNADLAGAQP